MIIRALIAAFTLFLCAWSLSTSARGPQVVANGWYLEDAARALTPTTALEELQKGTGDVVESLRFNLGNRDSHFWLLLNFRNTTDKVLARMLDMGVPFRAGLTVYQLDDQGLGAVILHSDDASLFHDRATEEIILHTSAFDIDPAHSTTLLLEYTTRGSTYMPMSLRTEAGLSARLQQGAMWSAFFYTASMVLLTVCVVLGLGLRERNAIMYAGLFLLALLFIASTEGYAFKYLWPTAPGWNQYASLFLLLFTCGLGFFAAIVAMPPNALPRWGIRTLVGLGSTSLTLSILCAALPFSLLAETAGLMMLLVYLAQGITVASWLQLAVTENLIPLVSTLILVPIATVLLALGFLGFDLPDVAYSHSMRIGYLFTMTMTLASLATRITALRRDHEKSLLQALHSAKRDAELSKEVIQGERRYNKARELAATRQRQLASTSHDIRQPLTSLRAVIDQLPQVLGEQEQSILKQSLDYIEDISRNHITETQEVSSEAIDKPECYRADLLLHTIKSMFRAEADTQGISLRVAPCSAVLSHPPLVIMRVLSNLTANAVKHSNGRQVLLGCRRTARSLRFDVIDTGAGMGEEELQRIQNPYQKGGQSTGEGLGLAICWQLAADHGFAIEACSNPGRGSRFSLKLAMHGCSSL